MSRERVFPPPQPGAASVSADGTHRDHRLRRQRQVPPRPRPGRPPRHHASPPRRRVLRQGLEAAGPGDVRRPATRPGRRAPVDHRRELRLHAADPAEGSRHGGLPGPARLGLPVGHRPAPAPPWGRTAPTLARSALPASVTLSRTVTLAITTPALPGRPPREAGRAAGGHREMHAQLSRERQAAHGTTSADPCPWARPCPRPPSVAVRAKPTVPRTVPRPRFSSAMRPWTPQHPPHARHGQKHAWPRTGGGRSGYTDRHPLHTRHS